MKRLGSTRAAALLGITGGAAVLAAILRWVQLSNDIKSNGAVLPGRYLYLVIAVLSVAVLAALAVLIRPLRRQTRWEEIFSGGKLPNVLHIASAVCFVIGGVMLYYASLPKTEDEALALTQLQKTMNLLIPLLGAACAVTLVAFARKCLRHEKPSPLLYMIVSVYLIVRLIVNFQKWSTDPSLNDFVYHLFAAISCMLAAFQLAGFSFGKGKRRITLFWSLCAVYFSAISIVDCRYSGRPAADHGCKQSAAAVQPRAERAGGKNDLKPGKTRCRPHKGRTVLFCSGIFRIMCCVHLNYAEKTQKHLFAKRPSQSTGRGGHFLVSYTHRSCGAGVPNRARRMPRSSRIPMPHNGNHRSVNGRQICPSRLNGAAE